ncbi:MAG TPA: protein kinase [Bryobacteraceae bacterium]|nr:protein kinase [Bryobacteraceae bacterium]
MGLRFGDFELDERAGELRKHGLKIRLQDQSLQILLMLLERPGEVVLREEIRRKLWPNNTIVEFDHSINAAIKRLRNALGESAEEPGFIETLAKRGYRFVGEASRESEDQAKAADDSPREPATTSVDGLIGKTFSNYRLFGKLGSGGMGVVYRAEDTKLGRHVALKFLPAEFAGDATARQRFEREARSASALNHPGICAIYGLEELDGQPAIVMELVEGETLEARLARGPIAREQALTLAVQIAAALAEAHRKGIVHRDLKPSNIMLTGKSTWGVKILDFGIARMESDAPGLTRTGVVAGTLQYMSPEQAEGKPTDSRSDIYSFGVVLNEMLTGNRTREVAGSGPLERLLRRCLEQDREERWQSARDLKVEMEWIAQPRQQPSAPERSRRQTSRLAWAVGAVSVVTLALAVILAWRQFDRAPVRNWMFSLGAVRGLGGPALVSPDGSAVIYGSPRGMILRRMDSTAEDVVYSMKQIADTPAFSPDGRQVGFPTAGSDSRYIRVPLPNGEPELMFSAPEPLRGSAWGPDGTILTAALVVGGPSGLYIVPPGAHTPARVQVALDPNGVFFNPEFLPDGKNILFAWNIHGVNAGIYLATLENGKITRGPLLLRKNMTAGHYSPVRGGMLLYVDNDKLYARKLNVARGTLEGSPQQIVDGVFSDPSHAVANFSVSRNGVLVWQDGRTSLAQLTWFDRTGKILGTAGPPGYPYAAELSPDEKHILLYTPVDDIGHGVAEADKSGIVSLPGAEQAIWMPDSARILFLRRAEDGSGAAVLIRALDSGAERELTRLPVIFLDQVSPDGKFLLYRAGEEIFFLRLDDPRAASKPVTKAFRAVFSPDGRWVAYLNGSDLYAQRFPSGGLPIQLTTIGRTLHVAGANPVWRGDGKELLYLSGATLYSLRVELEADTIRAAKPEALFNVRVPAGLTANSVPLAVTRDGSRILFAQGAEQPDPQLTYVMTNWESVLPR